MSLLGSRLGAAIWAAVKATQSFSPPITGPQDAAGLAVWTAVANEIVTEIQDNAVVDVEGVDPPGDGGNVISTGTVS